MFRFGGRLDGSEFAIGLGLRIGLFVAFTLAYPYLLGSLLSASACRGVGGACGALALVVSMYVKPTAYVALVVSLIPITVRRLRDAALPVWLTAAVTLLILSDTGFATAFGAPWLVNFVNGGLMFAPLGLSIALMALIALAAFPSREVGRSSVLARTLGALLAATVLLEMTLPAISGAVLPSPAFTRPAGKPDQGKLEEGSGRAVWDRRQQGADRLMQSLGTSIYWNMRLQHYRVRALGLIALLFAAVVIAVRRSPGSRGGSTPAQPGSGPSPRPAEHKHATSRHVAGFGRRSGNAQTRAREA